MKDDLPDEEQVDDTKIYWPWNNKKVFAAYNTHAMRSDNAILSLSEYEVFELSRWQGIRLLLSYLIPRRKGGNKAALPRPVPPARKTREKPSLTSIFGLRKPYVSSAEVIARPRYVDMVSRKSDTLT
jgi:hypothetical protein